MSQNYYQVLGVPATATAQEIKVAYKRLAVQYHPDKHGGNALYEDLFKAVAAAYHVLGDVGRRAQYDYQLQLAVRRAEELRRRQQFQNQTQHLYGVPMPPPAPLRTRRPAASAERHYRTIPKQRPKFTRRDYWLTSLIVFGLLVFMLSVKVTMDHVTAVSNYQDGVEAYSRSEWSTAHSFFTEALHFKPTYLKALRRRGEVEQFVYHNYTAARADYLAALRETTSKTERATLLLRIGQCHKALAHPKSAQEYFARALALDTTLARAWLAQGENLLFRQRQFRAATRTFSAGLRHTTAPTLMARMLLYRGLAHYKLQDFGAARADYWQVLTITPRSGQVYFLLGRVAQQEGATQEACEFFRRATVQGYHLADTIRQKLCTPVVPQRLKKKFAPTTSAKSASAQTPQ
ncbi:J domain-containing protein [Hymenobacter mucosus]|uniref:Tetratricopeptide repeat-containing protein n=1 Tax=Hymenobacter mucosus TaxID=1411120 RepID=A0A238WS45_9BACT|nr:DnaJ domain-containing protein [Hymenobacter mucosus]SNR49228.1 Tetratricopeptide repeat-containing protein [Hymenobacter mucosus]